MSATTTTDFLHATLGRTGRAVHRLGVAASFGIGGKDLEAAVEEHGVSYLYWGSMRTRAFGAALRDLCRRGLRDRLFIVVQSYSRLGCLVRPSLSSALRKLGIEQADLLLLGWWNKAPSPRILDAAQACKDRGLVRHLGVSTHERPLAPALARPGSPYDVVHVRYNAANRGAEREVFPQLPPRAERAGLVTFTATRWGELLRPAPGAAPGARVPTAGDCYRFALSTPDVDVCLSGPADGAQLRDALATVAKGPLDPDERAWIEAHGKLVYDGGSVRSNLGERF
jgi:aryl-alcohol dehydrogenase-like predicted oxidoreductase